MSDHITDSEWKRYFDIAHAGMIQEEDADFMEEIDAHVVECDQCFEKIQAMRLLLHGASSSPELAEAFIQAEFPEILSKPAFDIRKAFVGVRMVKERIGGGVQILADTLSGALNARFLSGNPALAAVRGNQEAGEEDGALNDLLHSDMELPLADGRRITLRCRSIASAGDIRLFVYSNFAVEFTLYSDGEILCPVSEDYDKAAGEYVRIYELGGSVFELTVP